MNNKTDTLKRFLSIFLLSAAITLSVLFLIYRAEVKSRIAYMETRDAGIVSTIESAIYHDMNTVLSDLNVLRDLNEVENFLDDPRPGSKAAIAKEFLAFSEGRRVYDQIRLLDDKGMEVVRVNFNNGAGSIVPDEQLQDKSGRYYFKDTFRLSKGDIYLSPFDLNVENGQIEKPLKPVMRIGTPLFDSQGRKKGVIIFNYLGSEIINDIKELSSHISGHAMLVNPEGYWLVGQRPEDEWGFMFREGKDLKIENRYPAAWKQMAASDSGQFYDSNGLFIFKTIHPTKAFPVSKDNYWKLMINVPPDMLSSIRKDLDIEFLALSIFLMLLQGVGACYLAISWTRKNEAEGELQKAHDELEARVHERTEELEVTTEELRSTNEDLHSSNAELHLLQTISIAVNEAKDFHSALDVAISRICKATGWDFGEAWLPSPDGKVLEFNTAYCDSYCGTGFIEFSKSLKFQPGVGLPGRVWSSRKAEWVKDVTANPAIFPRAEGAVRAGLKAGLGMPIIAGERVLAVLEIFTSNPREEDSRFVDVISAISTQLGNVFLRKLSEESLEQSNLLLKTISVAQSEFISDTDPRILFDGLLKNLLGLTGSEYGFIGETFYNTDGSPYLKTHAITNIAWNDETRALYDKIAPALEFRNLKSLFGEVMTTGKPVISNNPASDPRRCGIPEGHPPLNAFLGLPFYSGNELTGMVGIANRQNGYDEGVVEYLQPFLFTCSNIITAYRVKKKHRETMEALARSEANLTNAQKLAHIGSWQLDIKKNELIWSDETCRIFKTPVGTPLTYEKFLEAVHPDDREYVNKAWAAALKGEPYDIEHRVLTGGETKWVREKAELEFNERREFVKGIGTVQDITIQKNLEAQLLQSQKMDAVGQLAGGIAHDFNNALTAILGFSKLLLMKRGDDELIKNYAQHIVDAGEGAASLVDGILAFSRKQTIIPQPIDISELVRNVEKILPRLIGEDIELRTSLPDSSMITKADPTQIEQILMNLTTNARDAMPNGGSITIDMEPLTIDDGFVKAHGYGEPGNYVLLSFADTGTGMDEETRKKIFEPFFTTKEVGKGTGLGLASVYGIVKQHSGFINVYSEPGKGTTFRIYLPLVELAAEARKSREIILPQRGTETLLLVEDDESVREITLTVLEDFGYNVIVAVDGEDAIRKFKENRDIINLCISDMVMPKKGGIEAFEVMRKVRPDLRVIFMSGYAADKTKGIIEEGLDFISKPVSPNELLKKVREVLDR